MRLLKFLRTKLSHIVIPAFAGVAAGAALLLVWTGAAMAQPGFRVTARNIQDNQPSSELRFGTITRPNALAQQFLEVTVSTLATSDWAMEIYTNNTGWQGGGFQRGGLANADQRDRLPLMWQVYDAIQPGGLVFDGNPAQWAFLKDKGDRDDPSTSTIDESYQAAQQSGYVRIAGLRGLGGFPVGGRPFTRSQVYVYLGALAQGRPGRTSYQGTIGLDFLFDPLRVAPPRILRHVPFQRLHRQRQPIVINAEIQDDTALVRAVLHFRRPGERGFQARPMAIAQVARNRFLVVGRIPGPTVLVPGVEYTFAVSNGVSEAMFQPLSSPHRVELQPRVIQLLDTHGGRVEYLQGDARGMTTLLIPPGALTAPVQIQMVELDVADLPRRPVPENAGAPVTAFRLEPSGLILQRPLTFTIRYLEEDETGRISGTNVEPKQLGAFWWDGFEWRFLQRGQLDPLAGTVTFPIYHFSDFALFPVSNISDLYRPRERIITPNGDGKNDIATFDGLIPGIKVVIFDVQGRVVREFSDVNFWDGRDDDGRVVESGVYIYQVHAPEDRVSGVITVAK